MSTRTDNMQAVDTLTLHLKHPDVQPFVATVRSVAPIATTDQHRETLTHVLFEIDGAGAAYTLTATDSYRLATAHTETAHPTNTTGSFLMPAKLMLDAVKQIKRTYTGGIRIEVTDETVTMSTETTTHTAPRWSGEFPKWRTIDPSYTTPSDYIAVEPMTPLGLNPELLPSLIKCAAQINSAHVIVTHTHPRKPWRFETRNTETYWSAILMPVRLP